MYQILRLLVNAILKESGNLPLKKPRISEGSKPLKYLRKE
jgi:hypothetical protein